MSQDQTGGRFGSCDFSSGLLTPKSKPSVSRFSNYSVFLLSVSPDSPFPSVRWVPRAGCGARAVGQKRGSEVQLPTVLSAFWTQASWVLLWGAKDKTDRLLSECVRLSVPCRPSPARCSCCRMARSKGCRGGSRFLVTYW